MPFKRFAKGRIRPKPGTQNQLEVDYEQHLKARLHLGELLWVSGFEPIKLRLAKLTTLTVDYFCMNADGELEAHDVKGFWEDDARAKMKVAAELFPFVFVAATRRRKADPWVLETF